MRPPRAILQWSQDARIETALVDVGKPWQDGANESFNGKFHDEYLSLLWFGHRVEAEVGIEQCGVIKTKSGRIRVSAI